MTARLARLAEGLVGAALTVALLAGPPWLLTTLVGPPIPASWPNLDTWRAITTTGVTDTFVITTLAVIIWLAWAQLAVAILVETAAVIRRRPPIRLPLMPGTQPLAAKLVAATLLLASVLQPRPAATAPLDLAATTTFVDVDVERPATSPHPLPASVTTVQIPTRTITVGERDSWWSLAETHLGDGLRWRELRDLNAGRILDDGTTITHTTEQLPAGSTLLVPTTDHDLLPPDARDAADGPDTDQGTGSDPVEDGWEVQPGEHFWHIAETTLTQAWDRTPTNTEIVDYWHTLIDTNRHRLAPPGDPDLIHPGQHFELPPIPTDPTAPAVTEPDEDRPTSDQQVAPADDTQPDVPDLTPPAGRPHTATDVMPPAAPSPPPDMLGETGSVEGNPAADEASPAAATPAHETSGRATTPLGAPTGATGAAIAAAIAAAGVVSLVRRRRRALLAQRPSGWRLPTLASDMEHQLGLLEQVAPHDKILDDLAALLATIPPGVDPPLLVIHDDGPISLIDVDTDLPPPWTHDPGAPGEPARWTARIGDLGRRRSIGLPLLLTLGHTGTSTVYANLGALGILPIEGPADQVTARLRTMTLELATSRLAGPVEVTVCGDDMFADLDQVVTGDDPTAAIAATVADTKAGIIDDDRIPRMIVCHAPSDVDLLPDARPLCGLVTAGTAGPDGWALKVDGGRGWLHIPDSEPQPLTLPELDPTLIGEELDSLSVEGLTRDTDEPDADEPGADSHPAITVEEPAPYCQIGLLGPITVTCDGTGTTQLTPIARQVLTYLATHRDGVNLEQLDAAIWPELPPSAGGQRARTALTRLRTVLGDGPDGQPLLPRRSHAGDLIRLSDHVGTDLDRAYALLDHACHADTPEHALEGRLAALVLIRGQPFTGLTVSWSVDIEQRAITQLQDAALTVAPQLTDVGEHDQAIWAIRQALRLCDPTAPLYVAWAQIEHARGRPDRIPHLWRRLQRLYADDADEIAGLITTPTPDTERAFTQLLTHH